ncbi:MAG: hypothetical protein K6D98_05255 [Clostridiales bacterium]|nr:hypothetical protein [Clostridia bacterium]MCR5353696.1 hypothetical protein [Clostridiales bacterium]
MKKNVWQYAYLPAAERLDRIRNGDADVYEKELARSMNAIAQREELGIDTQEQKEWVNKLNYNYNKYNEERLGLSETPKKTKSKPKTTSVYGNIRAKAETLLDEYYEKAYEEREKLKNAEEYLVNNGISKNSDDGKRYLAAKEKEIETKIKKLKNEYLSAMKKLASER